MPTLICPHCQTPQAVSDDVFQKNLGKKCRCRQCQKTFTIEVQTPPPAAELGGFGDFDFLNDDSPAPAPAPAKPPQVPAKTKAAAKPAPSAPLPAAEPEGFGDFDFLNQDSPAPAPAPAAPPPAPAKPKAAAKPAPSAPPPVAEPEGLGDFDFLNEDSPAPAPAPAAPSPVPAKPKAIAKPAPAAAPAEELDFSGLMAGHGSPPVAEFLDLGLSEPALAPIAEAPEFPSFGDVTPTPTTATAAAAVPKPNAPLTRQSPPAGVDVSLIRRGPGGSIQTPLGNGVVLNQNSSITREWITISDPGIPTQLVDETGIGTAYEKDSDDASGHYFYHAKYAVRTQVPIRAMEVRFLTFNLWGGHEMTLSAVEIQDLAPDKTHVFEGKWSISSKNAACAHYASIAFVSQIRTADGKVLHANISPILAEAKRFSEKFSEADLEPTPHKP